MEVVVAGGGEKELDQDKALENEKKREIIAFQKLRKEMEHRMMLCRDEKSALKA